MRLGESLGVLRHVSKAFPSAWKLSNLFMLITLFDGLCSWKLDDYIQ